MPLFQSSVITKHLQNQNKENLALKWESFKNHFHNPKVQEEIKSLKEEQYQGEFLEDFFVKILGYTKPASSSETKFNLTTEYKNIKDSKKADGAIIVADVVKAVIELKGTNTTDLGKIEVQAFGYKNNQPECTYVITSNFEKLRFYIDNAIEHLEFNLFTLTEKDFNLLYLCLAYENIEKDIPKKIKEQSISQEDAITKKLYNDYSLFKRELHQSLVILNPQFDALTLFQKSQKLLDRFLFLFFAEDRQLLPPNSVRMILDQWKKLQELDEPIPLYNRFKKYFGYLNTGFKGKQYDVYAYNGGLFLPDEVLDTITIDDDLLYKHTLKLSEYDFISEVDVNILGHIFENSLNELDEIKAQLAGEIVDKTKTKRKKDGVFYTPKYITKYIVENTIGKLCIEKKAELQIIEEEYSSTRGLIPLPISKKKKQELLSKLTNYRNWLLQLTICDPACGSGAFLNQALDFLINEHKYIDELQAKLFGDAMVLSDVEKSILENNLFGVDLNEESVEIAKLSLWLRTAQPNRKLNDLNNNIKCGNSLIDDVSVAGDKAFNWQQEFPQIFKEKNKKAFHITTAVHDSRTSERMIEFKVREKRDLGTNPYPNISYFTQEDEFVITQTIAKIVKDDDLNVLAYNICADHIHLLLVCEEEEITKIVQKIKSITSKNCTQNRTSEHTLITREHAPLPLIQTMEHASLTHIQTRE
ncbi:MAG: transposase, partial [Lutibacter sp.]|nr:transposase [Lutibacter sp.]